MLCFGSDVEATCSGLEDYTEDEQKRCLRYCDGERSLAQGGHNDKDGLEVSLEPAWLIELADGMLLDGRKLAWIQAGDEILVENVEN